MAKVTVATALIPIFWKSCVTVIRSCRVVRTFAVLGEGDVCRCVAVVFEHIPTYVCLYASSLKHYRPCWFDWFRNETAN